MKIEDLILKNGTLSPKMGPILRDHRHEDWVEEIYSSFGSSVSQKIYNVLNSLTEQPTCDKCGKPLKFMSFKEGYKTVCSFCQNVNQTILTATDRDINELKIKPLELDVSLDKPYCVSQEKDFENKKVDSSIITVLDSNASEESLLKEHGLDPKQWKLAKIRHSKWQNFSNKKGLTDLYASKIQAVPRTVKDLSEEDFLKRIESFVKFKPKPIKPIKIDKNECTLVIPVADFHFGLISQSAVSGDFYNMDLAEKRLKFFISKLLTLLENSGKKQIKRVIITFGNDFFNSDNLTGTTTKGTPQDQDSNYYETFERGVETAIGLIEAISDFFGKSVDIDIYGVQSNHDKVTSYTMMTCLKQRYNKSSNITVDVSSIKKPRFYIGAGTNLLGFGHETKITDCARLMSTEAADLWSSTLYRTFFIAHLHHEEVNEIGSVTIRRLPIVSGISRWTNEMGLIGNTPRAQVFVYNNLTGLENIWNINVDRVV